MNSVLTFLAIFVSWTIDLLELFIFLRIILSWFPVPPGRISNFLRDITNPLFRVFARLPFARIGFLDLTPLLAYFSLQILSWAIQNILVSLGTTMITYPM